MVKKRSQQPMLARDLLIEYHQFLLYQGIVPEGWNPTTLADTFLTTRSQGGAS